jgi:hypothetical protein
VFFDIKVLQIEPVIPSCVMRLIPYKHRWS